MCMRTKFIKIGEKIFNVLVIIAFIAGAASGVASGMTIGHVAGLVAAIIQIILSWSGTLIISLIVYSLLGIYHTLEKNNCTKQ